jgi:hypothetical protein
MYKILMTKNLSQYNLIFASTLTKWIVIFIKILISSSTNMILSYEDWFFKDCSQWQL